MRAFSLIELIFVMVIMGVMTFVGLRFIPNETLTSDTQMLKQKILEKKSNALGYSVSESNLTCIVFDRDWLNEDDNTSSQKVHYVFKSDISVVSGLNSDKICFDTLGRVYDSSVDEQLTNLVHTNIIIKLKYNKREKNITIYPITGSLR